MWFTGHTFSPEKTATECELSTLASAAGELAYLSTRQWDDFLLTHDDNAGPYVPTTVAVDPNLSAGGPVYRVEYHGYHEHMQWPQSPYGTDQLVAAAVFAPLPEEVFIKPPDAKRMAIHAVAGGHLAGVLRNVRELYAAGDIEWPLPEETEAFLEAMQGDPRRYAYRTFLCLSARHQEHVVTCAAMPPEVKRAYTEHLRFPEYIWVTEISETAAMTSEAGHDRRVVGEVILDSTDSAALHTMHGFRYISLHVPGLLVTGADETGRQARTPSQSAGLRYWPVSVGGGYRPYDHNSQAEDTPRSHRQLGPISIGR